MRRDVRWNNFARNLPESTIARLVDVGDGTQRLPIAFGDGLEGLHDALALAEREGARVRAFGSAWSFSPAMLEPELMIDMTGLRSVLADFAPAELHSPWRPRDLVHVQSGIAFSHLNARLEAEGRSLPCMTGRGGLTVGGAVATGSHGSAIDHPPPGDYVRAMSLVLSNDRRVWLERSSQPVVAAGWAEARGFELVRDDRIFDAALVGLGCFGVLYSIVLEVVEAFDLEHHWVHAPFGPWLARAVTCVDPAAFPLPHGSEHPYHLSLVINPHRLDHLRISVAYQRPAVTAPAPARVPGPLPPIGTALAWLARVAPPAVGPILGCLIAGAARPARLRGRLGTIFPDRTPRGFRPFSMEIALATDDAAQTLDLMLSEVNRPASGFRYPGFVAVRWVRRTRALLGFTRYDRSCTIELPSMGGVPGTLDLHARLRDRLDRAGIHYSEHPGQDNAYDPARLAATFGESLAHWRDARGRLIGELAARFASPWSDRIGLTGFRDLDAARSPHGRDSDGYGSS